MDRIEAVVNGGGQSTLGQPRHRGARMGALVLTCLALASGCSSSSTSNAVGAGSAAASGTSAADSATPTTTLSSPQATAALLTPQDVGAGFTEAQYTKNTAPLPCAPAGSPTLDQQVPPSFVAGRTIVDSALQAEFVEEFKSYASAAQATSALNTAKKGLQCSSGHLYASDGSSVVISISTPQDITQAMGVPGFTNATAWSAKSTAVQGDLVVAQDGSSLVFMTFLAPPSSVSKLPDPAVVTRKALEKIDSMAS